MVLPVLPSLSTKWAVSCSVLGVFMLIQTGAMLVFLLSALMCAVVNKALKLLLWQPRPDGAAVRDPGMPSSHAQMLGFLAVRACVWLLHGCSQSSEAWGVLSHVAQVLCANEALRVSAIGGVAVVAVTLARERYIRGLHTRAQVFVGAAVGVAFGLVLPYTPVHSAALASAMDTLLEGPFRAVKCACLSAAALAALSVRWLPAVCKNDLRSGVHSD